MGVVLVKRATVRISCDGPSCAAVPRQGQVSQSATDLREKLREVGWMNAGGRDMCPTCVAQGYRP